MWILILTWSFTTGGAFFEENEHFSITTVKTERACKEAIVAAKKISRYAKVNGVCSQNFQH